MSSETSVLQVPKKSSLITTGLALFSMFFGAGNLIFPLLIGKSIGENIWFAILGLGITAVVVPFLGLTGMVLYEANYQHFFNRIGKIPGMSLILLLQLILGPLGVIPRLITLMHAMSAPYMSNISLFSFSIFAVLIIFICTFQRKWLINFLGAFLTPILICSLLALMIFGLTNDSALNPSTYTNQESFFQGLFGGYNTMDLIAAFLFATIITPHFESEISLTHPHERRKMILKKIFFSNLIAASLLFLTYVGLCLLSARHPWEQNTNYPPEQLLSIIAHTLLGKTGGSIAAVAIITACLTTAITLASIFADYLKSYLCKDKIGSTSALIVTLLISALFANLGFGGIAAFLSPILEIVYPGLILLTLLNIMHAMYGYRVIKLPVFLTFAASAIIYFVRN